MKKAILVLLVILSFKALAQNDTSRTKALTKAESAAFFSDAFKKKNQINFPIFRAYRYTDRSGTFYVALTESSDTVNAQNDTLNYTIKAFNFKVEPAPILKKWEINDFKTTALHAIEKESSIWFWTKYCEFSDLDNDGLIEPIIVYGTFGKEGYSDGRAKILTFYKGQKIAIRHQNSSVATERKTQIDATFYNLPAVIQTHLTGILEKMVNNKHTVFANDYLEKIAKKATQISNE